MTHEKISKFYCEDILNDQELYTFIRFVTDSPVMLWLRPDLVRGLLLDVADMELFLLALLLEAALDFLLFTSCSYSSA